MTTWNKTNARRWLQSVGRSHVKDGLELEGQALLASCRVSSVSEFQFRALIDAELWWDDDLIDKAVAEVEAGTGPAAKRVINTGAP